MGEGSKGIKNKKRNRFKKFYFTFEIKRYSRKVKPYNFKISYNKI